MKRDILIWPAILAVLCGGCGHADKTPGNQQSKEQAAEQEWQTNVSAFAKRYNAIVDWKSSLPARDTFTADLSKALIRSNSPPTLLTADLEDVAVKDGNYTAQFSEDDFLSTNNEPRLCYELKCTPSQAERLMGSQGGAAFRYAIIAQVNEVSRKASDDSSARFVAKGNCVDFLRGGKSKSILGALEQ